MNVIGFDERNFAESSLTVAVFGIDCLQPAAWISDNHTSVEMVDAIPKMARSKSFQVQAYSDVDCNVTVETL